MFIFLIAGQSKHHSSHYKLCVLICSGLQLLRSCSAPEIRPPGILNYKLTRMDTFLRRKGADKEIKNQADKSSAAENLNSS